MVRLAVRSGGPGWYGLLFGPADRGGTACCSVRRTGVVRLAVRSGGPGWYGLGRRIAYIMAFHDEIVRFVSQALGAACTIGVDVGTTSVKAVAVKADGTVVARTRVAHSVGTPSADLLEHDVARAWRRGPRRAFAEVSAALDGPAAGVVVTSMVPSITAVDGRGTPLLPGLLYGDSRAADQPDPDTTGEAGTGEAGLGGAERYQGRRMLSWAISERPDAKAYWNCQATATHALTGVRGGGPGHRHVLRWSLRGRGVGQKGPARPRGGRGAAPGGRGHGPGPRDRSRLAYRLRWWVDRRLLRADRGRGQPARRRAGHLRGHPDHLGHR